MRVFPPACIPPLFHLQGVDRSKPLRKWTSAEVAMHWEEHNMGRYRQLCMDNDFNGLALETVTLDILVELGVSKLHAMGILKLRDELK
jgi:hypothetical protein